jgi:hypothetical protein
MNVISIGGPTEVLRTWLLALPRNAHEPELNLDTDIIETGILDSLEFINFLMLIESLRAEEIPADGCAGLSKYISPKPPDADRSGNASHPRQAPLRRPADWLALSWLNSGPRTS